MVYLRDFAHAQHTYIFIPLDKGSGIKLRQWSQNLNIFVALWWMQHIFVALLLDWNIFVPLIFNTKKALQNYHNWYWLRLLQWRIVQTTVFHFNHWEVKSLFDWFILQCVNSNHIFMQIVFNHEQDTPLTNTI